MTVTAFPTTPPEQATEQGGSAPATAAAPAGDGGRTRAAGTAAGGLLARLSNRLWYARSVRAQLLITFVAIDLVAALIAGGVTILQARKSTRLEIAASLRMAEILVGETAELLQQELPAEHFLANLPAQLRSVRHLRITVRDASGLPVAVPAANTADAKADERSPAPGWFVALIAPPIATHEVPVMVKGQRIASVLLTAEPRDEIAEVWENTLDFTAVAVTVSLAVIGALYVLLGRVLVPLTSLGAGLVDLERRNYRVRLARPKARELAAIADRFNALAQALDTARAENARLNRRLITAQDDERRRTARELHDEVGPSLFGLKANATSIANAAGEPADAGARDLKARARDMLAIIEHLQTINRSLLNRLRPMALGHIPLADLVSQIVRERARQHPEIAFDVTAARLAPSYGDSIDLTVYRCVQEGVTNAIRHAQATRVAIELALDADGAPDQGPAPRLLLQICDDGCGIDPAVPMGRGLMGMQERVQGLSGSFLVEGAAGQGTTVRIGIPLPARLHDGLDVGNVGE